MLHCFERKDSGLGDINKHINVAKSLVAQLAPSGVSNKNVLGSNPPPYIKTDM